MRLGRSASPISIVHKLTKLKQVLPENQSVINLFYLNFEVQKYMFLLEQPKFLGKINKKTHLLVKR